MKLMRVGPKGSEKPCILDARGQLRDLSGVVSDLSPATVTQRSLDRIRRVKPETLPILEPGQRTGSVIDSVPNFFCIGLNYVKHAQESGAAPPKEPILFAKATSALAGPNDDIVIPKGSSKTDWEVELGVVIAETVSYVSEATALDHVAGYCVINDMSEREFQLERGGQWIKGKSAATFGPVGPWLVTADEVADPQALHLWLDLNGKRLQDSSTADMIFGVAEIISYMSRFMVLQPGDIISTGTPAGVGMGLKPPRYLKPGDTMHLGIDGLGEQTQKAVAYKA